MRTLLAVAVTLLVGSLCACGAPPPESSLSLAAATASASPSPTMPAASPDPIPDATPTATPPAAAPVAPTPPVSAPATAAPAPAPRPAASSPRTASTPRTSNYPAVVVSDFCSYRIPCYRAGEHVWVTSPAPIIVNGRPGWIVTSGPSSYGTDTAPAAAIRLA